LEVFKSTYGPQLRFILILFVGVLRKVYRPACVAFVYPRNSLYFA